MNQEEYDRTLYNIIIDVWDAYRKASKSGNAKYFNEVFQGIYEKNPETCFVEFTETLGMAFVPSVNRAVVEHEKHPN